MQSSFKFGVAVSVSDSMPIIGEGGVPLGKFSGGVSDEFVSTITDTVSDTITKSRTFNMRIPGNVDGIDHQLDQFYLLLNPAVHLRNFAEKMT